MAAAECIFCKIVAGTAQCHELYRDETTLAFMDILLPMKGIVW